MDYYEEVDFSQTVYVIEDDEIVPYELRDLCQEHAEETTTTYGIDTKYHTRDSELWSWGHAGNNPKMIMSFDSNEEAEHALLLTFLYDLEHNDNRSLFYSSRKEAETALLVSAAENG